MYFRNLRFSIFRLIEATLIITILLISVFVTDLISIQISNNVITIGVLLLLGLGTILSVYNIIGPGISALHDIISKSFVDVELQFAEQYPFRSSVFDERKEYGKGGNIINTNHLDYKVIAKYNDTPLILTSETFFPLEKNVRYIFTIGVHSQYIVNVKELDG
ncbi:MAG: hypothetical protein SPI76_05615 [Candidatus Fimenecus sp.]|nr:hypothetical protein [Candidatus Fimenecus sp.]